MPQATIARGRKPDPASMSSQARKLLKTGMSVAEIAKKLGSTTGLVYNLKWKMGLTDKRSVKRGPGRPPRVTATRLDGITDFVTAVRKGEHECAVLRAALGRIQGILADVLA